MLRDDELAISEVRAYGRQSAVSGRSYTVLKLRTKSGLSGYGECGVLAEAQLKILSSALAARPASGYEVLNSAVPEGARAAVNMAALDILGKSTKAPVYRVLGGPTRNKARGAVRLKGTSDEELQSDLHKQLEAGFRAFLLPIPKPAARNQGSAFVRAAEARWKALRNADASADFVLEATDNLTPGDAATLATALERMHPLWFDEPCRVSNLNAIRKIGAESVMPLGFGREITEPGMYQDLLRNGLVDVIRPDLLMHGITGIRRLAAMSETYYVAVAPQHDGGEISTAAALHLAASIPNFFIVQTPGAGRAAIKDGFFELPKGDGLGIEVNDTELERSRIA
jgi:galactonate dehydratase